MNLPEKKEQEAYEPPVVTDIAPVSVTTVRGDSVPDGPYDDF